jgi:hypothetical protein
MKPFKETKAYRILKGIVPGVVDTVATFVPGGSLIKGIVDTLVDQGKLTAEEVKELREYEQELFALEIQDKASARNREIEIAKTGKHDFLMYVVGLGVTGAFLLFVYASIFMKVEGEAFISMRAEVGMAMAGIIGFYFGYSKHQSEKR